MTVENKLNLIAETLDTDRDGLTLDTDLLSLDEWDSMGVIATIAMLDRNYKKVLSAEQIENLTKVKDILDLMKE